ncbi:ADAM17 [Mytilus edulis]|uniref:ADAM17 n=1 Tax=Mytilus edulis TaxID=6550 RepID=A0A8S3S1Q5_MYTED|nr:ADAM17 [Mytilus edulis]
MYVSKPFSTLDDLSAVALATDIVRTHSINCINRRIQCGINDIKRSTQCCRHFITSSNAIEIVDCYKYLGVDFHSSGKCIQAVSSLSDKAKTAYFALKSKLPYSENLSVKTWLQLFNSMITPILTYGSEVWLSEFKPNFEAFIDKRHNWGSEYDPTSGDCAPGSIIGNGKYLMYPFSVTGEDSNNDDFSTCSKTYINAVLKSKAESCFSEDTSEAPCGNGRVDSGEQCDGGYLGKFDLDPCCTTSCQLKTGSICSPSNHACCTTSCQRASAGVVCSSDVQETCTAESVCTGSSLICPQGANKPLGASCLDGGQCDGLGTCKAYCEARGLQSCVCGDVGDSCKRCCKSASTTCAAVNQTAFHQDGRPCTVGYCRQVFSLLIWVPLSCVVWCRDKRSQKWSRNELNIKKRENRNLMVDQDGRPIKRPAKKPRSDNPYLSMEPRSLSGRPYSSRSPSTKPGKSQKNKVKPNRRRKDENHLNMSRDLDGDSVA